MIISHRYLGVIIGTYIIRNNNMVLLIQRLLIRMTRKVTGKGELLFFIQDSKGRAFGGFMTQGFALRDSFFGTGDCFIFKAVVGLLG